MILAAGNIKREVEVFGLYAATMLEGKIDLLLENEDGTLTIVDFKSDRIENRPDENLLKKYSTQLDFYGFILERCAQRKVKEHAVYFIRNGLLLTTTVTESLLNEAGESIRRFISIEAHEAQKG